MESLESLEKHFKETLTPKKAVSLFKDLVKQEQYHSKLYYDANTNIISDYEYDLLKRKIIALESAFKEYIDKSEVTTKIGSGNVSGIFEKKTLPKIMQSLLDVFSYDQIQSFFEKTNSALKTEKAHEEKEEKENTELGSLFDLEKADEKIVNTNTNNIVYDVETKIDGLSISLEYNDGKLLSALTRGNGKIGEDVTNNAKCILNLPHEIAYKGHLIVRGEVFLSYKHFELLNEKMEDQGKKLFANPRNAASGTLRQKNSEIVKQRNLEVYIFNIQDINLGELEKHFGKAKASEIFHSHFNLLQFVKELGFSINPYIFQCTTYEQIISAIEKIGQMRDSLSFGIDGAVIKLDDIRQRDFMGITEKYPKWAIAYKYPPEQKLAQIDKIELFLGRTGVLTPVAIFKKGILLDGSCVSKATLNNKEYIAKKDIRVGDYVSVYKAGDIIPYVEKVDLAKRPKDSKPFVFPTTCPSCGTKLVEEDSNFVCVNSSCIAKLKRTLIHFASKNAMNIRGFGDAIVEKLVDTKTVTCISDIYYLDIQKLEQIDLFKSKNSKTLLNLLTAINQSKNAGLARLLYGLGIFELGLNTSNIIAEHFKTIENIQNAKVEDFIKIHGLGEVIANNIYEYFQNENNNLQIQRLKDANVLTSVLEKQAPKEGVLSGKTFLLTGKFEVKKSQIEDIIRENGGQIQPSFTKELSYLVYASKETSKYDKALKNNIQTLTYDELLKLIENSK